MAMGRRGSDMITASRDVHPFTATVTQGACLQMGGASLQNVDDDDNASIALSLSVCAFTT